MASKIHVKTEDTVLVLSGKDAGRSGKVLKVDTKTGRVYIAGLNIVTKHQKAKGQLKPASIIEVEGSIDASNVMLVCPSCQKPSRVGHRIENGKKSRICKKCGAVVSAVKSAGKEG